MTSIIGRIINRITDYIVGLPDRTESGLEDLENRLMLPRGQLVGMIIVTIILGGVFGSAIESVCEQSSE